MTTIGPRNPRRDSVRIIGDALRNTTLGGPSRQETYTSTRRPPLNLGGRERPLNEEKMPNIPNISDIEFGNI